MATPAGRAHGSAFFQEVVAETPGNPHLEACLQCGTCGGSCPSGADMEHTPRALFAMIAAGMRDAVLRSNTPWFCVSCYYCMERCPQDIHITDLMYTLKRMAIQEGLYRESTAANAPGFSTTFIDYVEQYGRSFELGLITRYYLRHQPLSTLKIAPLGMGMLKRKRLDFTPRQIKGIDQLKAILAKAREIDGS
ncbi:MAG: 4Fe-4S dicluster domain-containing protein [Chloroflexaceae bacterium]|nr:4Fe-4S dicluster domain-containing protein [Chloroflexaceae bacterium]